jgi:hypothetical protein
MIVRTDRRSNEVAVRTDRRSKLNDCSIGPKIQMRWLFERMRYPRKYSIIQGTLATLYFPGFQHLFQLADEDWF